MPSTGDLFALIYLGIGTAVGALVHDELNGSLIVLFVWMFDMFLGPGFSASHSLILRILPTHYPTLLTLGIASGHSTATEDLAVSIAWTIGASALGAWLLVRSTRPGAKATFDVTFTQPAPPGTLELACHVGQHYEKGMRLPIVVEST